MAVWASSGNRAAPACARAMLPSLSKSRRFIKAADSAAVVEFLHGLTLKSARARARKATTPGSASSIRQRGGHFWYSRRTTPFGGGSDEALEAHADRIGIGGCCDLLRGTAGLPTSGRLWLRERRLSEQCEGGVLLVAPGLYREHAELRRRLRRPWLLGASILVARLSEGRPPVSHRDAS